MTYQMPPQVQAELSTLADQALDDLCAARLTGYTTDVRCSEPAGHAGVHIAKGICWSAA